jgi:hypothetical protein
MNVRMFNTLLRGCLWNAAAAAALLSNNVVLGGVLTSEEAWKEWHNISILMKAKAAKQQRHSS